MSAQSVVIQIRIATCLTQKAFAKLAGLHRTSVSQFETGARIPCPHHAKKYLIISQEFILGFKLDDFYQD